MSDVISRVIFEQNPPENLRKSNFFSFVCRLFNSQNQVLKISSAVCVGFIENSSQNSAVIRNGVRYRLTLVSADGTETDNFIHVLVVDSDSNEIVPFQGQDRNPSMTRVLLTHESICSRCAAKKSCGNKNDTPADPVIQDYNTKLKVFLKCNQNCLINAGNPRELRKFKLTISGTPDLSRDNWAYSTPMFVHNNSKHGRVTKSKSSPDNLTDPSISLIWPQPGPSNGGRALIVGRNFNEDTMIIFGTTSLHSKMITPDAIQVEVPPRPLGSSVSHNGVVSVTLLQRNQLFSRGWYYTYSSTETTEVPISVSPLNLSINRIGKPFSRHYNEAEQLASFSSMLGISRGERGAVRYMTSHNVGAGPHSPTFPPPPRKPIPVAVSAEQSEHQQDCHPHESEASKTSSPADESPFSYSNEESAFNRVFRDQQQYNMESKTSALSDAEKASRLETATILSSLKTQVRPDYIKLQSNDVTTSDTQ